MELMKLSLVAMERVTDLPRINVCKGWFDGEDNSMTAADLLDFAHGQIRKIVLDYVRTLGNLDGYATASLMDEYAVLIHTIISRKSKDGLLRYAQDYLDGKIPASDVITMLVG